MTKTEQIDYFLNNYKTLSQAIKTTGTFDPDENLPLFEEFLTKEEYDLVYDFLQFCHSQGRKFGYANYELTLNLYFNTRDKKQ